MYLFHSHFITVFNMHFMQNHEWQFIVVNFCDLDIVEECDEMTSWQKFGFIVFKQNDNDII